MPKKSPEQSPDLSSLDLSLKMAFQRELMHTMLGISQEDHDNKTQTARQEWVAKYARWISDLVEDPEIRPLIENKDNWEKITKLIAELMEDDKMQFFLQDRSQWDEIIDTLKIKLHEEEIEIKE